MRFTWANISERRILVSNLSVTRNSLCELHTLDWSRHVGALPENRLRRLHVLKYATQLSCIRKLTFRWISSQFLITSFHGFPRSIVTSIWDRFSFLPIYLLQHSHSTFVIIRFRPFSRLFINLTMCVRALFLKPATTLGLVEQAFWRVPFFTEWICASSFEVILARQSSHFPSKASASKTLGSRCIFHILPHRRARRRIRLCRFCTLMISWRKLQMSPLEHCPLAFHCQHSPRVLCSRCCPLILDHGVCLIISVSGSKILNSRFCRYFFLTLSSICDNQVLISSDESPYCQFQSVLSFSDFVFLICAKFPRCIRWDVRHDNRIRPIRIEFLNIISFEKIVNRSA